MKPKRIALWCLMFAQAAVCLSCERTAPQHPEPTAQTRTLPIPNQLDQLDPSLRALIERQVSVVEASPDNPMAYATLGLVYEANNLWTHARACYETAYAMNPDEPTAAHRAAIAAGANGDFAGTMAILREAAGRFPDFAPIHHRLGDALLKTGRFEEAGGAFEQAIASAPDHPAGYIGLGDVHIRLGHDEEAIKFLERAVKTDGRSKQARYLLGTAYRNVGRDQEAREQLGLGVNATTRFIPDAWSSRLRKYRVSTALAIESSETHRKAGRFRQAARVLEDALAFHPEEIDLLTRLGAVYLRLSQNEDALRVFLRADDIDSMSLPTCINLVTCYQRLQRHEEALAAADRAVKVGPAVWQAHYNRAAALARLERYDEAIEARDTARRLVPDDPAALEHIKRLQVQELP